ncbi:MAG: PEP-CTERM sorting domain-containing protein [Acetobacteraceae bacterium]
MPLAVGDYSTGSSGFVYIYPQDVYSNGTLDIAEVSSVPEPSAALLLATGLLGLGLVLRRRAGQRRNFWSADR